MHVYYIIEKNAVAVFERGPRLSRASTSSRYRYRLARYYYYQPSRDTYKID